MKNWMLIVAAGALSFNTMGCDIDLDAEPPTGEEGEGLEDPGLDDPTGGEVPEAPKAYSAILIRDLWLKNKALEDKDNDGCRSLMGADGADIDAVALVDEGGSHPSYWFLDKVVAHIGRGLCPEEDFTDTREARDAPDGTLYGGFVSLRGGWLAGEFEFGLYLAPDLALQVFEVGMTQGASAEDPYEVYAISDISCVEGIDPERFDLIEKACGALLLTEQADGEAMVPLHFMPAPQVADAQ